MPQKKVFIFIFSLTSGGAEKMLTSISRYISKQFAITFVIYALHPQTDFPYSGEVIEVAKGFDRSKGMLAKLFVHLRSWWRILQVIRRHRPDTIITCLPAMSVMVLSAYKIAQWFSGVRSHVVVRIANSNEVERPVTLGNLFERKRIFLPLLKWLYRSVNGFVVISEGLKIPLSQNLGVPIERIKTIYNGFEPDIMNAIRSQKLSKKYDFMTQGRLVPVKRHDVLIQAMATVVKKVPQATLLIVGQGELKQSLQKQIKELNLGRTVTIIDWLKPEQLFAHMASSRVFVMSSDNEGFGMVIIEAMSLGVPVVSTDCPSGPPEILDNGKYGMLTPKGNAQALAEAMLTMLTDKKQYTQFAQKALERATYFDIRTVTKSYEQVL